MLRLFSTTVFIVIAKILTIFKKPSDSTKKIKGTNRLWLAPYSFHDLVRPDGLPVRRPRTVSPKPSDYWFKAVGLNANLRRDDCDVPMHFFDESSAKKSAHSKMSLPSSPNRSQRPMYKGLKAREGTPFSLPSPSRFRLRHVSVSAVTPCGYNAFH